MSDRRDFLKTAAAGTLGLHVAALRANASPAPLPETVPFAAPPLETVRIGFVGVGHQGSSHVENFLKIDGVAITAICDINPAKVERMQALVTKEGGPKP
ncbi:MAG: twin-arginine translocation signal domain-containing protein, partial [Gemmatimonadota bacterium]|nr:twin-arginine translocation signal domain-containing protein [Gemmatimonadota bacterium]